MRANSLFPQLESSVNTFRCDEFLMWVDFFAERYGTTPDKILELPIPMFYAMQEAVGRRSDLEKKQMNRGKR